MSGPSQYADSQCRFDLGKIQIKSQLQRLTLTLSLADLISKQVQVNQIEVLPITLEHVFGVGGSALSS